MESAPQSTINHRAVIALPQILIFVPTPVARSAEYCTAPAQRVALQIGGEVAKVAAPAQRHRWPVWRIFATFPGEKSLLLRVGPRNGCRSAARAAAPCPHRQGIAGPPNLRSQCRS